MKTSGLSSITGLRFREMLRGIENGLLFGGKSEEKTFETSVVDGVKGWQRTQNVRQNRFVDALNTGYMPGDNSHSNMDRDMEHNGQNRLGGSSPSPLPDRDRDQRELLMTEVLNQHIRLTELKNTHNPNDLIPNNQTPPRTLIYDPSIRGLEYDHLNQCYTDGFTQLTESELRNWFS